MTAAAAQADRAQHWLGASRGRAVRRDNLGDVLMPPPARAALRDSLPGARITLLCGPVGAAAAPHLPMVDEVWSFSAPWMQRSPDRVNPQATANLGRAEAALVDRIAEADFDAVVIFTVCTQSALPAALLCRLAGIPLRLAHCRENPYQLLTDWVPETDVIASGMRHEVQRQLDLVASVGFNTADERMRFQVRPADRLAVTARLRAAGIGALQPYVVLHPGASAESRRWPAPSFGAAAEALAARGDCAVVFSGDGSDLALVERACREVLPPPGAAPVLSLVGELNLSELAALIEGASVLVANNSGPSHLAAALGTPVVSLYALTNPQHTPWRVRSVVLSHDVPCRWCLKSVCPVQHNDCLRRIEPERVVNAALGLMNGPPDRATARLTEALTEALTEPPIERPIGRPVANPLLHLPQTSTAPLTHCA